MRVPLRYGKTNLTVELPERTQVLRMNEVPILVDPASMLHKALRSPIASAPLAKIARGRHSAVVVVSDVTRPVPHRVIVPPIVECLEESGVSRSAITLLVATGLHRPNWGEELEEVLSSELVANYRVVNHDARDIDSHRFLGTTSTNVPVWVDEEYMKADLRILTGLVEPHLMAGYSGGRKLVCPGIAAAETIKVFHSPRLLENENATNGILKDNPVHQTSLEAARMAGVDFIVNVTLDEPRNITGIFAGELEAAHRQGVEAVNRMVRVPIDTPADVVVTSSAGYPLDTTFYQAVKGLVGALPAVKQGGCIIMAASLSEGIGGKEVVELLTGTPTWQELERKVLDPDFFMIDQWQAEMLVKVLRKCDVFCRSDGLDSETLSHCHVHPTDSIESTVVEILARRDADASVFAIPEGPYVMPVAA